MSTTFFAAIGTSIFFALALSNKSPAGRSTEVNKSLVSGTFMEDMVDNLNNLDMDIIMSECNESFSIEISYLQSLNESGSFIDETERTPKCFIRCMLMNMDVISTDGVFNPARAALIFAGERNGKAMDDIADMTAICAVRDEPCHCDRSYQFMKCLMSMEIEKYETATQ